LIALAYAAPTSDVTLDIGYGASVEIDKNGGVAHFKVNIPATAYPNNGTTDKKVFLRFYATSEATSAGGAVLKYWVTKNVNAAITDPAWKTKSASQGYGALDYLVPNSPYYNLPANHEAADYILTVLSESCGTCISTVEIKVGVWVIWKEANIAGDPEATAKAQDFKIREESYTLPFTLADSSYGAAGWFTVTDKNIFVRVDTSLTNKAVIVFTKNVPALASQDPIALPETATFKRFPSDDPKNGDFRTGGKLLEAGLWYFQAFSVKAGSPPALVQFALGNGHEPAAAGMVVPSFAILAVAIVSLLAHLL